MRSTSILIFMKLVGIQHILEKISVINFHDNPSMRAGFCVMTDRRTDMIKLIVNLSKLSNMFKKDGQEITNFNTIFTLK